MTDKRVIQDGLIMERSIPFREMQSAKPYSRWDPEYWHPKYENVLSDISTGFDVQELDAFMLEGTEGITYGSTKPREWADNDEGVRYVKQRNVKRTGLDIVEIFWTPEGGNLDGKQYRVKQGDIIMNKSGTGTFGRLFVVIRDYGKMVVSQDTMRIRVDDISPHYVVVYLQTKHGRYQVEQKTSGVSGQVHINFDHVRSVKIPVLPTEEQQRIKEKYLEMHKVHVEAMEAKKNDDDQICEEKLQVAESKLKSLIDRVEQRISGEIEEV